MNLRMIYIHVIRMKDSSYVRASVCFVTFFLEIANDAELRMSTKASSVHFIHLPAIDWIGPFWR